MSKKALKAVYGLVLCIGLLTPALTPLVSWAQEPKDVTINYIEAVRVPDLPPYEVHAYVTVSDAAGAPITGIDADNFTVLENGKEMTIAEVATAVDSVAVVLMLDTSDSMRLADASGGLPIEEAKKAAVDFVWSLTDQDKVAVFSFNEEATLEIDFTIDHGAAINAVNPLATEPKWTCLYDAAFEAVNKAAEIPRGRRAIVLLTDGKDQGDSEFTPCSTLTLDDVIDNANTIGVPFYPIGLGNEFYLDPQAKQDLERLAKLTGGRSDFAPTSAELGKLFEILSSQLKNQYVVNYRSETAGGEDLIVMVKVQHRGWQGDDQKAKYLPPVCTTKSVSVSPTGPVTQGEVVSIEVAVACPPGVEAREVQFYIDDQAERTDITPPYVLEWDTREAPPGLHTVRMEVHDDEGPTGARELSVYVTPPTPTPTATRAPTFTPTLTPSPAPTTPSPSPTPTPPPFPHLADQRSLLSVHPRGQSKVR